MQLTLHGAHVQPWCLTQLHCQRREKGGAAKGRTAGIVRDQNNKMDEEGVSEEQGLIIDPVSLINEQSGEDWTWGEYKELNLCKKEELRNWRVQHFADFKF